MKSKSELQLEVASLGQKLGKVRGEFDSLTAEAREIKGRMVSSRTNDGDVAEIASEAMHMLRENQTRRDVALEAISELELLLKNAQQELDDRLLAETAIPWQELESDLWKTIPGMQKALADMNSQVVSLYDRMAVTKAVTADAVPLKAHASFALQVIHDGIYKAWQNLETLNQMSPRRVGWPNDGSQVPGFGKKL